MFTIQRKMRTMNNALKTAVIVAVLGWAIAIVIIIGKSYMEAKTFNKYSGGHVTTMDAIWADFKVVDCVRVEFLKGDNNECK